MTTKKLIGRFALAWMAGLAALTATAQEYPSKPIRWVLGYPAGGANDFIARTVAVGLSQQLGQQVLIDNKAGASGLIAAEIVAKAPADGYTLFTVENGIAVNNAGLFKKLPYNAAKDFDAIGMMVRFPMMIAAYPGSKYNSAKELVEGLRGKPGSVNYATPGIGTPHNLAMEMLKDNAQISATPVHYKGGTPALQDVMGGQVELMLTDFTTAGPYLKSGKLKPIGVFSKGEVAALPGVQSFFDLGYTSTETSAWQGMVVPAGTPAAVKLKLENALAKTLAAPEIRAKLHEAGLEITPSTPSEMSQFMAKETANWLPLIRSKNITIEGL